MLATLSYGHFATDLSQGAIPTLLPVFKTQYHLSYTDVGLIVLMANISSSVIQPIFGILSDRIALRWLMPAGVFLAGTGIVLAVRSPTYAVMLAMVFVSGLGVAAFHPEGYKFAGLSSGESRATGMSYFSVGGNLGFGLGPAAASIAISLAGRDGMMFIIALGIPAAILLWRVTAPDERQRLEAAWNAPASASPSPAGGQMLRTSSVIIGLIMLFVVIRSWISVGVSSFIPLYFTGVRHTDPRFAGVLVSVFLGAGAAGTLLGGPAADRWGHRLMLVLSMAILPPLLWILPRASGTLALAVALIGGMAVVSTFAVAMVMAQSLIPGRIGLISGLVIGFAVGTGGIGVTLLGAIADRWGLASAMDVTALLPIAAVVVALLVPPMPRGAEREAAGERTSMNGRARTQEGR